MYPDSEQYFLQCLAVQRNRGLLNNACSFNSIKIVLDADFIIFLCESLSISVVC